MAIFLSNMALPMLDASCHLFFSLRPLVTSLVSFSNMALPTTDLNSVDCHFPIQHGTPHVGCFLSFVFYFADPLLLPPSTHPPFHSFHTRHAPPRHRLLLFVVAAGFRSLFSGLIGSLIFTNRTSNNLRLKLLIIILFLFSIFLIFFIPFPLSLIAFIFMFVIAFSFICQTHFTSFHPFIKIIQIHSSFTNFTSFILHKS